MLPGPPPFRRPPPREFPVSEGPPSGEFRSVEFELANLQRALNLSEDQVTKIRAILEEFKDQVPFPMEKRMPPEKFDSLMKAREKKEQEIEKVLTDGQKERYRQIRREKLKRGEE
jgi:hypothetical protein